MAEATDDPRVPARQKVGNEKIYAGVGFHKFQNRSVKSDDEKMLLEALTLATSANRDAGARAERQGGRRLQGPPPPL